MLRRIDHGDYDLIITFLTLARGKVSVIAKSAKKSVKRFAGILEPFYVLEVVCRTGRGRGLPVLQEAVLKEPFSRIRTDIKKTAYASYWAELINKWMEEGERNVALFKLFEHVLGELDRGHTPDEALSILFQIRFMTISGHSPNLRQCSNCKMATANMRANRLIFDIARGGLICERCASGPSRHPYLAKGTVKQLMWMATGDLKKAGRIRFSRRASQEALEFLEAFVPYHLGGYPRSLKFLRQIRENR